MEPRTVAVIKGFVFAFVAFVFYFLIPYTLYNFFIGVFRDIFILYNLVPEVQTLVSSLASHGFPVININFGLIILLGIPISISAFFLGFFKGETVGHGLGGLTTQILFGVWFLLGLGTLGTMVFFLYMSIPIISMAPPPQYVLISYLNYTSPWIFDIQGIINLFALIIFLSALIYLVEIGIGVNNKDYWRYWKK